MIARVWRGWTSPQQADAYEEFLREKVIPGIRKIKGHQAAYVLRLGGPEEVEFMVINLFDSLETVKAFAGENYTVAVFEPEARRLLSRIEPTANHYEVCVASGAISDFES